jgi:hypothetical protein
LEKPTGSGEDDFALLKITGAVGNTASLPPEFPFLPPDTGDSYLKKSDTLLLAAYPSAFLGGILTQTNLNAVSTFGKINRIFTFGEKTPDLISIEGSLLAQQGSSGGAVASSEGKLLAIISATTESAKIDARLLDAITLSYIDREISTQSGANMEAFLTHPGNNAAVQFRESTLPLLKKILFDELLKN